MSTPPPPKDALFMQMPTALAFSSTWWQDDWIDESMYPVILSVMAAFRSLPFFNETFGDLIFPQRPSTPTLYSPNSILPEKPRLKSSANELSICLDPNDQILNWIRMSDYDCYFFLFLIHNRLSRRFCWFLHLLFDWPFPHRGAGIPSSRC